MVEVGTVLLGQYTVTSIGNDSVELREASPAVPAVRLQENP